MWFLCQNKVPKRGLVCDFYSPGGHYKVAPEERPVHTVYSRDYKDP